MSSAELNARTRREWRELGFFYDRDEAARRWEVKGSRAGVRRFAALLRAYAADPRNAPVTEHDHYGPYMYLKVMTWTEPMLDGHAIAGRPSDLVRLADLVEEKLAEAAQRSSFEIGADYEPASAWILRIQVMDDGFDPASADPLCQDGGAP